MGEISKLVGQIWSWCLVHWGLSSVVGLLGTAGGVFGWFYSIQKKRLELKRLRREEKIEAYMRQIAELDPLGTAKYIEPEPGDDPELLAEAWRRCRERRK